MIYTMNECEQQLIIASVFPLFFNFVFFFKPCRFSLEKKYYGPPSHYSSFWCAARLVSVSDSLPTGCAFGHSALLHNFFLFFFVLADPTLWHHVIRFSRSLLLDESNPGLQPRCLLIFNWFQKNFAFCVLCDFAKEK